MMKSKFAEPVGCLSWAALAAVIGAATGTIKRLSREHGYLTRSNDWQVDAALVGLLFVVIYVQSQFAFRRLKANARILLPEDFENGAREKGNRDSVEMWTVPRAAGKNWKQLLRSEGFHSVGMNCFVLLSGALFLALFILASPYGLWIIIIAAITIWLTYLAYFHPEVVADSYGVRQRKLFGWNVLRWDQIDRLELIQKKESEDATINKQLLAVLRSVDGREILQLDLSDKPHWQSNALLYFISRKLAEKQTAS